MNVKRFVCQKEFSCNVYIFYLNETGFMIDPGYFDCEIENYIRQNGKINYILLTHGHFDHINGIKKILNLYPNVKIYALDKEIRLINDDYLNGSELFTGQKINFPLEVIPLQSGKNKLNGVEFNVLSVPGHTKGSACYFFKKENVLFSGDTFFLASVGRTDLPTGSEFELESSIHKIKNYGFKDDLMIYPGHDQSFTFERLLKINPYFH